MAIKCDDVGLNTTWARSELPSVTDNPRMCGDIFFISALESSKMDEVRHNRRKALRRF